MKEPTLNITFDLIEHARTHPADPALIRAGQDISHAELDTMVWRVAQYLHDLGARRGHVVALTFQSEFFLALALLALTRLGATTLTIRKSATPYEIKQWISVVHPSFMLTDIDTPIQSGLPFIVFDPARINTIAQVQFSILCERPEALLSIHVGSGSTGQPKLIPIAHEQMHHRLLLRQSSGMLASGCRVFKPTSLEFASSQTQLLQTLHEGAGFCLNELTHLPFKDQLDTFNADVLSMSVYHAEALLDSSAKTSIYSKLKQVRLGASAVSMSLRQRIRERICENLWVGYGTNETGLICVAQPPTVFTLRGTVGQPLPGVSLSIVNNEGQALPTGHTGHIKVKSPGCISHYLGITKDKVLRPSSQRFQDNTFYPGDIGQLTDSGELILLGRSDLMMIYNGINIYPAEIEMCLSQHPAVRSVVAFPLQSSTHQDVPVCAIELSNNSTSSQELLAYAVAGLGFKAPKQVFIVNGIPRTNTGKVIRAELFKQIQLA